MRLAEATYFVAVSFFPRINMHTRTLRNLRELSAETPVLFFGLGAMDPIRNVTYVRLDKTWVYRLTSNFFWKSLLGLLVSVRLFTLYSILRPEALSLSFSLRSVSTPDLIFANEVDVCPALVRWKKAVPMVLDVHDYSPSHLEPGTRAYLFLQPYKVWVFNEFVPQARSVMTFGESAATLISYLNESVWVVRNIPVKSGARQTRLTLNNSHAISKDIHLVYHGLAGDSRGLRVFLDAVPLLPENYFLHLMIWGRGADDLRRQVRSRRSLEGRVLFEALVSTDQIPNAIARFDIGLVFFLPTTLNHEIALPGKFFESMAAGLPVISSPNRDLSQLIQRENLGWVSEGFGASDLVATISAIEEADLVEKRRRVEDFASTNSWKSERAVFWEAIQHALNR